MRLHNTLIAIALMSVSACTSQVEKLPVMGRLQLVEREVDGKTVMDTIPHTIADFQFLNQDSTLVSNETLEGKIYVADFFFTSCPSICPIMKSQLIRIYKEFETENDLRLVSYSIDPKFDTVAVLSEYAERLGVSSDRWHFLTGDQDDIYELGESSYMVTAAEDESAPGGFLHSGAFLLVDKQRRVRGVYDGTVEEQVDTLMDDIRTLLGEYAE